VACLAGPADADDRNPGPAAATTPQPCCASSKELNAQSRCCDPRGLPAAAPQPRPPSLAPAQQAGIRRISRRTGRLALAQSPEAGNPGRSRPAIVNQLNADTSFTALCLPPEIAARLHQTSPAPERLPMNCASAWRSPPGGAQRGPASGASGGGFSPANIAKRCMWAAPAPLPRSSADSPGAGAGSSAASVGAAATMWATGAPVSACVITHLKAGGPPRKRSALPMRWIWVDLVASTARPRPALMPMRPSRPPRVRGGEAAGGIRVAEGLGPAVRSESPRIPESSTTGSTIRLNESGGSFYNPTCDSGGGRSGSQRLLVTDDGARPAVFLEGCWAKTAPPLPVIVRSATERLQATPPPTWRRSATRFAEPPEGDGVGGEST